MFQERIAALEPRLAVKPRPLEQPASGHHRIACGEPCDLLLGSQRLQALVWNISVVGVYVVMAPPLPAPGETLGLSFTLPGDRAPIACEARVKWQNGPAIFKGCGRVKLALPPGCGVEFIVLAPADLQRIEARVRATLTSAR